MNLYVASNSSATLYNRLNEFVKAIIRKKAFQNALKRMRAGIWAGLCPRILPGILAGLPGGRLPADNRDVVCINIEIDA
jgi:hypothetical protein